MSKTFHQYSACLKGPAPPPVESAPSMLLTNDRELTERELEDVTTVFHTYETGLRTGTIHPKVGIACPG